MWEMPDARRTTCKSCGKHRDEVGPLSWTGLCGACGPAVFEQHNDQLHTHSGPWFTHWRRAMAASVGGVLLDDVLTDTHTERRG